MAIKSTEIWSDLHHDLIIDAQGKLKKVINIEAVKTSIHNILGTSKGERVMLRDFGSGLKGMLFENIDDTLVDRMADEIRSSITFWDNRIIVNSVNFQTNVDRNEVGVTLYFAIRGYDEVFSLNTVV
jgi:phage baseplate assembly protein W